jgi:hypothetical protein
MDLKDTVDPRCKKSKTEIDDPKLDTPKTAIAAPSRPKLLRETVAPSCKKSNTDIDDPTREMPNTERAAPMRDTDRTDNEAAK